MSDYGHSAQYGLISEQEGALDLSLIHVPDNRVVVPCEPLPHFKKVMCIALVASNSQVLASFARAHPSESRGRKASGLTSTRVDHDSGVARLEFLGRVRGRVGMSASLMPPASRLHAVFT